MNRREFLQRMFGTAVSIYVPQLWTPSIVEPFDIFKPRPAEAMLFNAKFDRQLLKMFLHSANYGMSADTLKKVLSQQIERKP